MRTRTPDERRLTVRVTGGTVRGVREGSILAWRGIPYAAPPTGPLRLRAPQPVVAWSGVREAVNFGNAAPQAYKGQFRGVGPGIPSGEDCLTINVLASAAVAAPRRGRPVMVFIHGGGYSTGSSRDFAGRGEGFVRSERVVYVSFDYRLGALGYMDFSGYSTAQHPIDSNTGLRDQVAALAWVRHNIRRFGGDPHNVTIFGESAGGNAVTTLLATPSARGLFTRAIAQSSPAAAVYPRELARGWAEEVVTILRSAAAHTADGAADEQPGGALLVRASAMALVDAALTVQIRTPDASPGTFCLAPTVDGSFLPETPLSAIGAGRAHRVPLIIGTNDREGSVFRGRVDILPRTPERVRTVFGKSPASACAQMRQAYPGLPAKRSAAIDFGGDFAFWYPSVLVAELHSRYAPVHAYRFDVAPRLMHVLGLDATHGTEMFTLFDQVDEEPIARAMTALGGRDAYRAAGERMRQHWLDFACHGALPALWPRYLVPGRATLIIDDADRVESDPRAERRLAWETFFGVGQAGRPAAR